jgi:hypothetical protein
MSFANTPAINPIIIVHIMLIVSLLFSETINVRTS